MANAMASLVVELSANIAKFQTGMGEAVKSADNASRGIKNSISTINRTLAGLGVGFSALKIIEMADAYTSMTAILKISIGDTNQYSQALDNVNRISREAQVDIISTGKLYARLNASLKELGANQATVSNITEVVSLALKSSGATAEESASTILQLSQAFGSVKLGGDEFRAISEAAPGLMRILANSLGVPIGALKEMSSQGKLTSDILANVFSDPKILDKLREDAKGIHTFSSAFVVLKNSIISSIGVLDKVLHVSESVNTALSNDANNLTSLFKGLAYVLSPIPYVLEIMGKGLGAVAAQLSALMHGELKQASNIGIELFKDIKQIGVDYNKTIDDILKKETVQKDTPNKVKPPKLPIPQGELDAAKSFILSLQKDIAKATQGFGADLDIELLKLSPGLKAIGMLSKAKALITQIKNEHTGSIIKDNFSDFKDKTQKVVSEQQLKFSSIGMTQEEIDKMTIMKKLTDDAHDSIKKLKEIEKENPTEYTNSIAKITSELEKQKIVVGDLIDKTNESQRDWKTGLNSGIRNYFTEAQNFAKQTEDLVKTAFSGMEDALVNFVKTGKLDFKSLADSIITDLIRIQIRQSIVGAASSASGWLGTMLSAGVSYFTGEPSASASTGGTMTGLKVHKFDVGTDYVPKDMLAMVHRGEKIVPAKYNKGGEGGQTYNVSIQVNSDGSSAVDSPSNSMDFARKLETAIKSVLVNEKRNGGLLAA